MPGRTGGGARARRGAGRASAPAGIGACVQSPRSRPRGSWCRARAARAAPAGARPTQGPAWRRRQAGRGQRATHGAPPAHAFGQLLQQLQQAEGRRRKRERCLLSDRARQSPDTPLGPSSTHRASRHRRSARRVRTALWHHAAPGLAAGAAQLQAREPDSPTAARAGRPAPGAQQLQRAEPGVAEACAARRRAAACRCTRRR